MACYHPLIGIPSGVTENGKVKYSFRGINISADPQLELKKNEGSILIPCGKCIGCRIDYSRRWADRMMLELETEKKAVFLTCTYDNAHVHWSVINDYLVDNERIIPISGYQTLEKRDHVLFMKSLRRKFYDKRIRFFMCGEYGSKTLRPHFHYILFGIDFDDIGDVTPLPVRSELGDQYYNSTLIRDIWEKGNILLAKVNWKSCAYVARYITKKYTGAYAIDYANRNCIPEFCLMSRRPGIGAEYLKYHPDCLDMANINISTEDGGRKISIPKYYYNKAKGKLISEENYVNMMEQRKRFANDNMIIQLSKTDLGMSDYLDTLERIKLDKLSSLKRDKL